MTVRNQFESLSAINLNLCPQSSESAFNGLGPCVVINFVAQSHTPHNCCVRFVPAVTDDPRNTHFRAARYGLTWTGLSPAGSHQLDLAH